MFADGSFGYRPNRSAKEAVLKVKEYAEQGYTYAVVLDLSKYFDTINHEILINLLRKNIKDERVVQLIKRYLKSGVMENGVVIDTEEGSPQGGNLSPLLANIYLNEFDQEFLKRGVPSIRDADDIVLLAKSKRASERLLESSTKYLEGKLKLTVNREKSRTVSVFAIRNFHNDDFSCPCLYLVHSSNPKHRVFCFELFGHTLLASHLLDQSKHHLCCLLVNFGKVTVQFAACEQRGVNRPFMFDVVCLC